MDEWLGFNSILSKQAVAIMSERVYSLLEMIHKLHTS